MGVLVEVPPLYTAIAGMRQYVIYLFKSLIIRQSKAPFKPDGKDCTSPGNPGLSDGYRPKWDSELFALGRR